jgi:hypothetical protein
MASSENYALMPEDTPVPANVLRRDSFQGGKIRRSILSQGTNPPAERYALVRSIPSADGSAEA